MAHGFLELAPVQGPPRPEARPRELVHISQVRRFWLTEEEVQAPPGMQPGTLYAELRDDLGGGTLYQETREVLR
jgi:hypothetical protein